MNVVIVPYDRNWPKKFSEEARKINHILKYELISIPYWQYCSAWSSGKANH